MATKHLTAGPRRFTVDLGIPDLYTEGSAGEVAAKIPPPLGTVQGMSDRALPAHYMEKNWQRDSTTHGTPLTETSQGPGSMSTTNAGTARDFLGRLERRIAKPLKSDTADALAAMRKNAETLRAELAQFDAEVRKGPNRPTGRRN
jgi:hypothetical protein